MNSSYPVDARSYLRDNFEPNDRLAIVLLNKQSDTVIQRIASCEKIASPDFQAWLRYQNSRHFEVYVSMNALSDHARGRTKADVANIRHIYLDFDDDGTAALKRLLARADLPKPQYVISSSPDKWQVTWKASGFTKGQAEVLQQALARESGADPAATDCARVLRLPGFYNHKYERPHWVRAELLAQEICRPEQFAGIASRTECESRQKARPSHRAGSGKGSQSERDWAFAKRALARGESPELIVAAIAAYRRFDKHDPKYYAELTVNKAVEAHKIQTRAEPDRC